MNNDEYDVYNKTNHKYKSKKTKYCLSKPCGKKYRRKKNRTNCIKRDRSEKFISIFEYETLFCNNEECLQDFFDSEIDPFDFKYGMNKYKEIKSICICGEFGRKVSEFRETYNLMCKKYSRKLKQKITKKVLIDFFRRTIPSFFKITIFGSAVTSMFSGIEANNINLIIENEHEMKIFIIAMKNIFGDPIDTLSNEYFRRVDYPYHLRYTEKSFCMKSYVFEMDQNKLSFDMILKDDIDFRLLDFVESSMVFNSKGLFLICLDIEQKYGYNINIIKNNLRKKVLTLNPVLNKFSSNYDEIVNSYGKKISTIKMYYKKMMDGYTIKSKYPYDYCSIFKYSYIKFYNMINHTTKLYHDVVKCIFDYLKINDSDICTYCEMGFENDLLLLIPQCCCGKKDPNKTFDFVPNKSVYRYQTFCSCFWCMFDYERHYIKFYKYCGERENSHNAFHMECFEKIVFGRKKLRIEVNKKCDNCSMEIL
jgi:hypothetical protein